GQGADARPGQGWHDLPGCAAVVRSEQAGSLGPGQDQPIVGEAWRDRQTLHRWLVPPGLDLAPGPGPIPRPVEARGGPGEAGVIPLEVWRQGQGQHGQVKQAGIGACPGAPPVLGAQDAVRPAPSQQQALALGAGSGEAENWAAYQNALPALPV